MKTEATFLSIQFYFDFRDVSEIFCKNVWR